MNGPDEPSARLHAARGTGHLLLYASLGLAVAAAATLALGADDARLLRLGVLVALWAALLGAFAAVKMRREATAGAGRTEAGRTEAGRTEGDRAEAGRAEDPSTIYRLELERDIAARREHELTMERELRREAKEDNRDELEAVRAELRSLRENLQQLFGGELLVERVAVRAESTRVRSLPEEASNLSPSQLRVLESAADLVVPHAGEDDAGSAERPAAPPQEPRREPQSTQRSVPTESPPLPRRDPRARADPARRPRPEAERSWSAPRSAGLDENPLFTEMPQRSGPSWTSSLPSAPGPWEPPAQADHPQQQVSRDESKPDPPTVPMALGRQHHGGAPEIPTGAHSDGRSVEDLLAAYGADAGARHRRRREDD